MTGRGRQTYDSGERFYGVWRNGLKHGPGKLVLPNKDYYEGTWYNDILEGEVRFVGLRQYYEGQFFDGKFHGYGISVARNGVRYQGSFFAG